MLRYTQYFGFLILFVSIFGFVEPLLGFIVPITLLLILVIARVRGRWSCGNFCPKGSIADIIENIKYRGKRNKMRTPSILKSYWVRIPILLVLLVTMVNQFIITEGMVEKIGMIFVIRYALTTSIVLILGTGMHSRTWCTLCPGGTLQKLLEKDKSPLKLESMKCINCKKCDKICPMNLHVSEGKPGSDCIKCEKCISSCPKNALAF
ncbi:polyferredoxin [Methanosalsum natronophilum]|nr:polyferredoxin [Methanosalsum natronophilum]